MAAAGIAGGRSATTAATADIAGGRSATTAAAARHVDRGPATAPAPYLRIRGLRKAFGSFTALEHIDLDIHEGEFVSFLGPSGCGKTTLLRAISGLDVQTAGSISQAGRDISSLPVDRRDFGIVFQSYALFPNLTIRANVGYGLVAARRPRGEVTARVDELLSLVGLSDQAAKYPAQLSGGQQQRVALARALALDPACCCSTSRSRLSMPGCEPACAARFATCSSGSASPPSWSPTIRRRR